LWSLGFAYRETGRYADAITVAKKASHREPNDLIARIVLTLAYIELGREDEAHAEALEVLRINPKFSVGRWAKVRPHIDRANTARAAEKLREAGLK
jgi:adenylate cyclase